MWLRTAAVLTASMAVQFAAGAPVPGGGPTATAERDLSAKQLVELVDFIRFTAAEATVIATADDTAQLQGSGSGEDVRAIGAASRMSSPPPIDALDRASRNQRESVYWRGASNWLYHDVEQCYTWDFESFEVGSTMWWNYYPLIRLYATWQNFKTAIAEAEAAVVRGPGRLRFKLNCPSDHPGYAQSFTIRGYDAWSGEWNSCNVVQGYNAGGYYRHMNLGGCGFGNYENVVRQVAQVVGWATQIRGGGGGCFGPSSTVEVFDTVNATRRVGVAEIGPGDTVRVVGGWATVQLAAKIHRSGPLRQLPGGATLTDKHPVMLNGSWVYPRDLPVELAVTVPNPAGWVYNYVLDASHQLLVDGVPCVTWGHGLEGPVVGHSFFGTNAVLAELARLPGSTDGVVEIHGTRRDPVTGSTVGFIAASAVAPV